MIKALLNIQGEEVWGGLISDDTTTYTDKRLCVFQLLNGKFKGEQVAVFEHGDKFVLWEGGLRK